MVIFLWLFVTWPWKDPPFLSSVNHLFRLGPSIAWRTVSHNQRVNDSTDTMCIYWVCLEMGIPQKWLSDREK